MEKVKKILFPTITHLYCCSCQQAIALDEPRFWTPFGEKEKFCARCGHTYCKKQFKGTSRLVNCGEMQFQVSFVWTLLIIMGYLLFGIANNTGVIIMGYRMPNFPEFLLYFTTLLYVLMFLFCAIIFRENFCVSKRVHIQCANLGFWTSVNGVLAQFAIPHLDSELTNVLVQISLPTTWFLAWILFRWRVTPFRLICFVAILGSLLIAVVPSLVLGITGGIVNDAPIFWILLTLASGIPTAFETVYQEQAYKEEAPPFVVLTLYNFYSLVVYFATIPLQMTDMQVGGALSWNEVITNQVQAFQCFFGDGKNIDGCYPGATTWVMVFTIGYAGMFAFCALILRVSDSSMLGNLNAILVPLGAIVLWMPFIVGDNADSFQWWILVSVILLCLFNILYARYATEDVKDIPQDPLGKLLSANVFTYPVIPENVSLMSKCCNKSEKDDEDDEESQPINGRNTDRYHYDHEHVEV